MAKYVFTGKINFSKTLMAFAVGIILALILGVSYGFLMEICNFIILDVLILFLILAMLIATVSQMVKLGSIRNKRLTLLLALVVSFTVWYTSWAYLVNNRVFTDFFDLEDTFRHIAYYLDHHSMGIGKINSGAFFEIEDSGMWILSGIETLLFMIPIFPRFRLTKNYFCESCEKFNVHQKYYIHTPHNWEMLDSAEYTGNFRELEKFQRIKNLPESHDSLLAIENIYEIDFSYCPSCKRNGIMNIDCGSYTIDDKTNKVGFESKEKVIQDVLIDDATVTTFMKTN